MIMTIAEAPWLIEFENVTSSGHFSDCTFVVEGSAEPNEVPAHKLILAMASPRFKEMFDEGLSEPNEPMMIPISGVNPEHFRALIRYIYTGRINLTSFEMARELWLEAKKYKLPHLEKKCKSFFYSVVGPSNACPIYEFASKLEDKTLMDLCIQIISANTKEVISDKSFVESELNTVLTVLSLDHLNVDSELELYNAVVKYDETRRRPGQSSSASANSADGGSPPEELSESVESSISENKTSLLNVERSQNNPEVKLDSKEPAEEVGTSGTPPDNKNLEDVAKYDNEPKTPGQSRSPHADHSDGEPAEKPAERLAERLAGLVERLAELVEPPPSPSVELDSKEPSEEVVKSEPPADNENLEDVAQRTPAQKSSSCADSAHGETPLEELAESAKPSEDKASLLNVESSKFSQAVEQDSQEPAEEVRTSAVTVGENLEDGEAIQELIKKIRFLTLTAAQFAEGPARSELLTKDQKFVILLNISMGAITTPMPDGFSESWVRRQQGKAVQETNAKPHPKPRTESCGDTSTKLPTPGWQLYGIIKGLASQDQDELKAAARAVRITTADDNASAKLAQLVNVGVIPLLVAVLNKPWSGVQYDAAWALTNIAQEHAYTEAFVNGGGVSKLLSLLDRGGDLSEQAALALGHIAQGKRSAVVNDGAITALVSQLMPSTPPKQLVACLWTYGVICENEPYLFRLLPALPFIKNLLAMNNEEVLVKACSILFYMTAEQHRYVFEFNPNQFTPELTSRLTALLGHAAPRVQAAALKALENVMAHNVLKKQCLGGFLDHIINLLICGDHSLVEDAARAVADILKGQPLYVKQVLDKGILDALVPVLTGGNDKCKAQAVIAVSAVCSKASASQLRKLAYGAALEPYCQLLADPENSFDVLLGLTNLLQNIEQNAVTALCIKLAVAEFDVPKLLIPMQKYKDDLVRERADHLLKTYFGEYVNEKGRL